MRTSLLMLFAAAAGFAAPDFRQLMHAGQAALAEADFPAAEKLFLEACRETDTAPIGQNQVTPEIQASCNHHLAIVAEAKGDLSGAESMLLRAIAGWKQAGPAWLPSYAMTLINLGALCRELHRDGDAEDYLSLAVDTSKPLRQDFPQIYPEALSRLGGLYAESGELAQARVQLTEAVSVFRGLAPAQNAELARALAILGGVDLTEGRSASATANLGEAVRLSIAAQGMDHPDTASYQASLALAYIQNHEYNRAEPLLKRSRSVIEGRPIHNNLQLGAIFAGLSAISRAQEKNALAVEYAERAIEVLEASPGRYPSAVLLARVNLGASWIAQGRIEDADRILSGAVAAERLVAPRTCLLADGLRVLASLRVRQRSWQEAVVLYRESIRIYQERLGPENPSLVPVLREYAAALMHSPGSKSEAKRVEARVRALGRTLPRA